VPPAIAPTGVDDPDTGTGAGLGLVEELSEGLVVGLGVGAVVCVVVGGDVELVVVETDGVGDQ